MRKRRLKIIREGPMEVFRSSHSNSLWITFRMKESFIRKRLIELSIEEGLPLRILEGKHLNVIDDTVDNIVENFIKALDEELIKVIHNMEEYNYLKLNERRSMDINSTPTYEGNDDW